jgi:pimeloyl-ACP methyl ester carboxylesterase
MGRMDQNIRFCTAPDGVRIAYATVGAGYPLVVCQGWISHLELDWEAEHSRRFWETLGERHLVVRYDRRGTGLSDRKVEDYSLEAQVGDLAAVISALGLPKIALLGFSAGGPIILAYAHQNPDIVSHLILYATYARGRYLAISDLAKALTHLIDADWGGLGSLAQADIYIPGASTDARKAFAEYQQQSADKEAALGQSAAFARFDTKHLLKEIHTPALVMHKRGDRPVPFELGRRLARDLPNSRFYAPGGRRTRSHPGKREGRDQRDRRISRRPDRRRAPTGPPDIRRGHHHAAGERCPAPCGCREEQPPDIRRA